MAQKRSAKAAEPLIPQVIEAAAGDEKPMPSLRHYEWYNLWAIDGLAQPKIAEKYKVSQPAVCQGIRKVYEYQRKKKAVEIDEMQRQHLSILASLASDNIRLFRETSDAKHAAEARAALSDSRDILGANAPKQAEIVVDTGLLPAEGFANRKEMVAAQLRASLERLEQPSDDANRTG